MKWNTVILAAMIAACNGSKSSDVAVVTTPVDAVVASTSVVGLDVSKVSIYQGIEVVLYDANGLPDKLQSPVIRKRAARVRVFVEPQSDWVGRDVEGVLEVETNDGTTEISTVKTVSRTSTDAKMGSTINFDIDAELLVGSTKFHLNLYEVEGAADQVGAEGKVSWNSGLLDSDQSGTVNVVIVPVRYNADGSGRLPDTTDGQIQAIHDEVMAMYPASEVNITVDPPFDWNKKIAPFSSNQWSDLLYAIADLRDAAPVSANTYYYGLFSPSQSASQFCAQGCILGLSNLAYTASDPWFRSSIGVGFSGDIAVETLAHEVGHAHGREHAPCGLGGQSSDFNFPYPDASLGTWGYNILTQELMDPAEYYDVMSYCSPIWMSDYQYYNLFLRIRDVDNQSRAATIPWQTFTVDEQGVAQISAVREFTPEQHGRDVTVVLQDAQGLPIQTVIGQFIPLSHLDGGMVLVPPVGPDVQGARVLELER